MARVLAKLTSALGWAVLGALALAGVTLSALALAVAASPSVSGRLTRELEDVIAGRVTLEAVEVLPGGELAVRGLAIHDPDGHAVVEVARALVILEDLSVARRQVRLAVELDSPAVYLDEEPDGGLSLVRAFALPGPASGGAGEPEAANGPGWTVHLSRLVLRDGALRYARRDGSALVDVKGLAVRGAARLRDRRVDVPVLSATAGATGFEVTGELDLRTGAFRGALTRLGIGTADARRLVPAAPLAGDLRGAGYAESDGKLLTGALEVTTAGGAGAGGSVRAAVALGIEPRVLGLDLALAELDPSRVLARAPPGRLTLTARGAVSGSTLAGARGRLVLAMAPSRLRGGEVGPVSLEASAVDGALEVSRLEARLPGLALSGRGRWSERGAVGGTLALESDDLGRLGANLAALAGAEPPAIAGRLGVRVSLEGTGAAPRIRAALEAPLLAAGGARAEGVRATLDVSGPLAGVGGALSASASRASLAGAEAERLELAAVLDGREASLSLTGAAPGVGPGTLEVKARARLAGDRRGAEVRELTVAWPAARFALARTASVTFAPPSVDLLALESGARAVGLAGGLDADGDLDVRLEVVRLDLAWMPPGLVPPEVGLRGDLSLDARVTGPVWSPRAAVRLGLEGAEVRGVGGLRLAGDAGWDGRAGRLTADLGLTRGAGGTLDLDLDLPLSLTRTRADAPLAFTAVAAGWPVELVRQATGLDVAVTGTLQARLAVSGTAGGPRLAASAKVEAAAVEDLDGLAAELSVEGAGEELRVNGEASLAGATFAALEARLGLALARLVRHPESVGLALRQAPLSGALAAPGLDLARVSGRVGVPRGLAGTLSGHATLSGTMSAPRGVWTAALADGAVAGYRELAAGVEVRAEAGRTSFAMTASLAGAEALGAEGTLGVAVEGLADRAVRRAAPVTLAATVPTLVLRRSGDAVPPLVGTVSGRLSLEGTLAAPRARLEVAGTELEVMGRPLGELTALVRHEANTTRAEGSLRPARGGPLFADATVRTPRGFDDAEALRRATAEVRVHGEGIDLAFLPALLPGRVRSASGELALDLTASGPVVGLRPRGTVKVEGGRVAVADLGDWSEVEVAVSLGDDVIDVSRLEARQGKGRFSGALSVRGLETPLATLEGRLALRELTVRRAGEDVVTLDFPMTFEGTVSDRLLDATVTVGAGTIRLPKQAPRPLQSVAGRDDVVELDLVEEAAARRGAGARAPFVARCRVVVPGRLFVKAEKPAMNLELEGDATLEATGGTLTVEGVVEAVRGTVEPISGRVFHVERAKVTFPGGAVMTGRIDAVARYDHPAAVVKVTVGDTLEKPSLALSSEPAMDDASIAMLIATGETQLELNTSGVSTLDTQAATQAVASAALTAAFTGLVADRLPVDQVSVDSTRVRAGKYVTDALFVGYAYYFAAKPEEGENVNEVKAEYRIGQRWRFELRYGDAQAGDAMLIWKKDY